MEQLLVTTSQFFMFFTRVMCEVSRILPLIFLIEQKFLTEDELGCASN